MKSQGETTKKVDKIVKVTKDFISSGIGLKKLKSISSIDDYDVIVKNKVQNKTYLIDSSLLGGSGIQTIAEGTNITVDNTDPLNPIISATGGGSSALFPNGFEFISTSRDFQAGDAGKLLIINDGVLLSMPETNPFTTSTTFGVLSANIDIASFNLGFEQDYIKQLDAEVTILQAFVGLDVLSIVSSGVSDDKTALRYLYDKSQNAIPLSGTISGSPVTGDIEVFNGFDLKTPNASANEFHSLYMDDGGIQLKYNNSSVANSFIAEDDGFSITSDNASFRGFKGDADYSTAYQVNDYTQLVYVGYRGTATLVSGTITVNTTSIKTGYKIYVSVNTPSGTQGFLSAPTGSIVNEISFVINSSSVLDNSTVNWWIAP